MRLRDLIRQIRAARTAADERAVVQKECAYIRSTFRDEDSVWRCRNVAKLLYIHMLGYPAHFGQLECLKLIASPRFTDKRIGYLGAMLLLDERQDVHLLITNSLKNDLNSNVQFVVGLALCTLGAICSPEMSRDLAGEIERLMKSTNTYIKKKATLCAARIVRRVPELMEMFLPASRTLLNEKNHGVLITGVTLITEMCLQSPDTLVYFKKMTINLVKILRNLIMAGYSPEHDVCGVSDPFLQVKILRLLRLLGHGDAEASDAMTDILAQVATNTESSKNVGNAILYETVLTIMDIKSDAQLRILGINILGRFLLNTDKNIRYVALATLQKTVTADYNAVQRHRSTIVDCLKDADVSIRRKAMELCFSLINENNIKTMTKDLLSFLEKAEPEFKSICSSNLCLAAEQFSPGPKWKIDCMIHVLKTAGNYVRDDVVGNTIQLISDAPSLYSYSVHSLWRQLTGDLPSKQPLIQVSSWVIGEYGELLTSPEPDVGSEAVFPDDVISRLESVLTCNLMSLAAKEYVISCLQKLSVRFPGLAPRVKVFIDGYTTHLNAELQQRSTEFSTLFARYDNLRPSILDKMPLMKPSLEKRMLNGNNKTGSVTGTSMPNGDQTSNSDLILNDSDFGLTTSPEPPSSSNKYDALADIMGLDLSGASGANTSFGVDLANSSIGTNKQSAITDVLSLFDSPAPSGAPSLTSAIPGFVPPSSQPSSLFDSGGLLSTDNTLNLDSLLSAGSSLPTGSVPKVSPSSTKSMIALNKDGLRIEFTNFSKVPGDPTTIVIETKATNSTPFVMTDYLFQAAVPKSFTLQLLPPSNTVIPSNNSGFILQTIRVSNPQKSLLRMRVKVTYQMNGKEVLEQTEVNNFPSDLWS